MQIDDPHNFYIDLKLPQETRLHFFGDYDSVTSWRLLSRYISRYPDDLRVHAQRIMLTIDNQLNENLPGALQDLSIVLAGKGKPFFTQLLDLAKPSLSSEDYLHFTKAKDKKEQDQCWKKGSVLASGVCSEHKVVTFTGSNNAVGFDSVLEEARAYIEYGQIEEAQQLLEDEITTNPDAKEIEEELLYLYRSTRQQDQLNIISNKLLELGTELSPEWKQCIEEANTW